MTFPEAFFIIVVAAAVGAAAPVLVRKWVPIHVLRSHHEVGGHVFAQMGIVFAVLLAFIFSQVWDEYSRAAIAIRAESSSLLSAAELARGLPDAESKPLLDSIAHYLKLTIRQDWPSLTDGLSDEPADDALLQVWASARQIVAGGGRNATLGSLIVSRLVDANKARGERLFQRSNHMPWIFWLLLLTYSFLLMGFLLFFGLENLRTQAFFTGAFSSGLVFMLVVVALLDYPFSGALQISSQPLRHTLTVVEHVNGMH